MAVVEPRASGLQAPRDLFSFTLHLSGFDQLTEEIENAIYESGCSDALLGIRNGTPFLSFDREATSFPEAIQSAINNVESCKGIKVVQVEPPGAETIESFNAFLRLRRDLLSVNPPDLHDRLAELVKTTLNR